MKLPLVIFGLLISSNTFACSFAPTTEEFVLDNSDAPAPSTPIFVVKSINRGFDDGDGGSCSDAGILTLKIASPIEANVGYIFEISEGTFDDKIFYDAPIKSSEFAKEGTFTFIWLDGESDSQEPINITVEITPVAKSGAKGKPAHLKITHPGVKKPWWKFW
jgi:hypothetical protein